ncbi:zinc metallopeptidase [Athalassotoga saccharophila]|uniref:zinc metallopeptidase n=1 Tax=Athalassotoga saccharophila TaxID=1441386 RepID=UPI00158046A2|nr:peptidase membrane zinc metallopeptidase [Athalassotoga saccharophila]
MILWFASMVLLIPAIILAVWAQVKVTSTFKKYSQVRSSANVTGAKLARMLLDANGLYDIKIERTPGQLTDHYDPRSKVIRLSDVTYSSDSIAALGVVAHETGHAVQHAHHYVPLILRDAIVPTANIGSSLSWIIFFLGLIFYSQFLMQIGIILFSFFVIFTLVTLPVELDASHRALVMLKNVMAIPQGEVSMARKVLNAAAMTYVASVAMAALQLLRLILISNMVRR